jgi:ethanolamine ammonia-lyase small subunit
MKPARPAAASRLQGRVALGDDAGERLGCQLVVVLIG